MNVYTQNKDLKERFRTGLKELGIDPVEVRNEWLSVINAKDCVRLIGSSPPYTNECVCGQYIEVNCYIFNPKNGDSLVVGSDCINKFIKGTPIRMVCDICNKSDRSHKTNLCKTCRHQNKDGLLTIQNCPSCESRKCCTTKRRCIDCEKIITDTKIHLDNLKKYCRKIN